MSVRILRGGLLAIVVDRGRTGERSGGVPEGGAADTVAYAVSNHLAGNAEGAAAIEVTLGDLEATFERDVRFALAGADCAGDLDGARVDAWGSYEARAGATLTLRRPRAGVRSYLAIAGGIDVPAVMGSRSTNLAASFGGFHGRALRDGDRLPLGADTVRSFAAGARPRCKPPQWDFAREAFAHEVMPVRLVAAGEYASLASRHANAFGQLRTPSRRRATAWAPASTAMPSNWIAESVPRVRCLRASFKCRRRDSRSCSLPTRRRRAATRASARSSRPILWKLAQLPIGARLRFEPCTIEGASQARRELAGYVRGVEVSLR